MIDQVNAASSLQIFFPGLSRRLTFSESKAKSYSSSIVSYIMRGEKKLEELDPMDEQQDKVEPRSVQKKEPLRTMSNAGGAKSVIRTNKLVYWLLCICMWVYVALYVQSNHDALSFGRNRRGKSLLPFPTYGFLAVKIENGSIKSTVRASNGSPQRKTNKKSAAGVDTTLHNRFLLKRKLPAMKIKSTKEEKKVLPEKNTTYGRVVGPFGFIENQIIGSNLHRIATCHEDGDFARAVRSRKFVLIFHELSTTGAPLSMIELATELLSCGATISAVALSRKGELMPELIERGIELIKDKGRLSFEAASDADLVIAGSAVCASWIEQYIAHSPEASHRIVLWAMENRREYFNRAKSILNRVGKLVFLSETQSKLWLAWCEEEKVKLRAEPAVVPLSVPHELASVTTEKRTQLRAAVRKEIGLNDEDLLMISLSSINPGKGQLLLLESTKLVLEGNGSSQDLLEDGYKRRRDLFEDENVRRQPNLKVLLGSVGCKSNKLPYLKNISGFLSQHTNLSKSVLWTPVTKHVAALYSAADIYVINAQGLGETFGRVTVEAMAFGLPVLGTDAGTTKEIVEHNITGLVHPSGHPGIKVLARNILFLVENASAREEMGMKGREKVERLYMKSRMYSKLAQVILRSLNNQIQVPTS